MRYADGTLIGDLGDNVLAITTGSVLSPVTSSIDENSTRYSLIPVQINQPPVFYKSITDETTPQTLSYPPLIRNPYRLPTIEENNQKLYRHPNGVIKVVANSSIRIKVTAEQPATLNIENGIPQVLQPQTGLTYQWFKDGVEINSSGIASLNSLVDILGNTITFYKVQPEQAGTYSCEASNDSGTTISDECTIEVHSTQEDGMYFRNIIQNPNGSNGVDSWESTNDELIARPFLPKTQTPELRKTKNIDGFGYTADMMNPKTQYLNYGQLINNSKEPTHYFTRTRFKYINNGGSLIVKAYQDVDLSDMQEHIRGGIYGIKGVRALFSCYIGNAISNYIPTKTMLTSDDRTIGYKDDILKKPSLSTSRLSAENFNTAGPGLLYEKVYVTIEEYNAESRVPSTIYDLSPDQIKGKPGNVIDPWQETTRITRDIPTLYDPWYSTIDKYNTGTQYYTGHNPSLGDRGDAILFAADELLPNKRNRPNYGQHIQLNKAIISQLNDKTTKIRITLNFETTDVNRLVYERWQEAIETLPDDTFEFRYNQIPANPPNSDSSNTWTSTSPYEQGDGSTVVGVLRSVYPDKNLVDLLRRGTTPRGIVTGLNLSLIPIFNDNIQLTDYYTNTSIIDESSTTTQPIIEDPVVNPPPSAPYYKTISMIFIDDSFSVCNNGIARIPTEIGSVADGPYHKTWSIIVTPPTAVNWWSTGTVLYIGLINDSNIPIPDRQVDPNATYKTQYGKYATDKTHIYEFINGVPTIKYTIGNSCT